MVSGCLSLCCLLLANLPDVAVCKERLRILTVGGTTNHTAGVSLRRAAPPRLVHPLAECFLCCGVHVTSAGCDPDVLSVSPLQRVGLQRPSFILVQCLCRNQRALSPPCPLHGEFLKTDNVSSSETLSPWQQSIHRDGGVINPQSRS